MPLVGDWVEGRNQINCLIIWFSEQYVMTSESHLQAQFNIWAWTEDSCWFCECCISSVCSEIYTPQCLYAAHRIRCFLFSRASFSISVKSLKAILGFLTHLIWYKRLIRALNSVGSLDDFESYSKEGLYISSPAFSFLYWRSCWS